MKKIFMLLSLICFTSMAWGQSLDELMQKALNGDVDAQVDLGAAYVDGSYGLQKNYSEAEKWYLKSARQGNSVAFGRLGIFYIYRVYNKQEAIYWLKKSYDWWYKEKPDDKLEKLKREINLGDMSYLLSK